jgi:hypothetical protein
MLLIFNCNNILELYFYLFKAASVVNWEDLVPEQLLKWASFPTFWAALALLLAPAVALLGWPKRQKLMPNIPVVGLEDKNVDIKGLRLQFRHGSRSVLLEGYQKLQNCDVLYRFIANKKITCSIKEDCFTFLQQWVNG